MRVHFAVQQVLRAANDPKALGLRLSSPDWVVLWTFSSPSALAADLIDLTRGDDSPEALHAAGLALLMVHRPLEALRQLRDAASRAPTADHWNSVAAAELLAAREYRQDDHLIAALIALDKSLQTSHELPEALFNRAVVLEEMGLRQPTIRQWRLVLDQKPNPQWSGEAHRRLLAIEASPSDAEQWQRVSARLTSLPSHVLERITARFPQQARRTAEGLLLSQWAEATALGDLEAAVRSLSTARTIGRSLREHSGDALVEDAVTAIDHADETNRRKFVEAYLGYRSGRLALKAMDTDAAVAMFDQAATLFFRIKSPMSSVARFYAAAALRNSNRIDEAREQLESLLRRTDSQKYLSLFGQASRELSLCYGAHGQWREASSAAVSASALFIRLGERENAADVGIIAIELSDMTGQRTESFDLALWTFRELSIAGAEDRLAAALAAAGHVEVRRKRWDAAHALATIEMELPATHNDPQLRTDNLIRLATIELNLQGVPRAEKTLAVATAAARKVPGELGAKLLADIDAVSGVIIRRRDPARAVAFLERSIAFQRRTARLFALPQIYLECARARSAMGNRAGAAADYDAGIAVLEQQRSHAPEAWRRIGIFDNATELFDGAAALALASGDPARAFSYVERRRARVLFDELLANRERIPNVAGIDSIRAALPTDFALLEYVKLDTEIFVFALTHDRLLLRRVAADAASVLMESRSTAERLANGADVRAALMRLHALLIDPVGSCVNGRRALVVVPDPSLEYVPFAALIDPISQKYRVEQQIVMIAPSATTFVASAANRSAALRQSSVAAFGNPMSGPEWNLAPLPQAEKEASRIARFYARGIPHLSRAATKKSFTMALRSFNVIHYAGHAISVATEPWQSALLFASETLTAQEIVSSKRLAPRVVVLAACSTARSENAVEGSPVLADAFLIAGVPTVIGTLWDIQDGEAGSLMYGLHERLAAGMPPSVALHEAQLSMLRSSRMEDRHPSRWAAFVSIGAP